MDELELLKSRWQDQDPKLPQLTYNEIYKMLLKKSSSIVKWILFISIGEILLWSSLAFLVPESSQRFSRDIGLKEMMFASNILYYAVFIFFIILFYRNYRKISATDSIKELMGNIIRTRRTVKYFIIYNLASAFLMLLAVNIFYYTNQDLVFQLMVKDYGVVATMNQDQFFTTFFLIQFIIGLGVIVLIILFYRFVYGTLLRRLKRNYQELRKMED
ncbi:hypothetical protein EI546_15025 [Aequorivita sp. H23M31]|uniref:Uncharacterized protein n=1 Tax=Aequorivita ciconiae TaxID=2494375 RepID=A0A410G6L9_9FLAO|nr:hypothetical protein [Aequorivita sp. H23M31]QAA82949.1 hypothetical protein EI546_15025 [Aequorivita sp. H23M31]